MRQGKAYRKTSETETSVTLCLDGSGKHSIGTGCGFLDHMLRLMASHGRFDLSASAKGDYEVDFHHTVEDVGIALGEAFRAALGDCAGICRYGTKLLPMDEALVLVALDVSGRAHLSCDFGSMPPSVGAFDTELAREFFAAVARQVPMTIHIRKLDGSNAHHIIEAAFKAFGRAMRQAVEKDPRSEGETPSTKGELL